MRRVLIVEDDDGIRENLAEILSGNGFDVRTAAHGGLALSQIAGGFMPDVILLDLAMPVMDGAAFRLQQRQRPDLASIPVIGLTAFPAMPAGMDIEVLLKPFRIELLLRRLAALAPPKSRWTAARMRAGAALIVALTALLALLARIFIGNIDPPKGTP